MREFESHLDTQVLKIQNKHTFVLLAVLKSAEDADSVVRDIDELLHKTQLGVSYFHIDECNVRGSIFFRRLSNKVPLKNLLVKACDYLVQTDQMREYTILPYD